MGYVGQSPSAASVTSSDIADGTISNADLAAAAAVAISKTALSAGTGITLDTNTLNVDASQAQITTVGTIGVGTWQASDVGVQYGGTGASALTDHGVVLGSGTAAVSVTAAGTSGQVLTSGGSGADPAFADAGGGMWELVERQSVTNSAGVQFDMGSAEAYKFIFYALHPVSDTVRLTFQVNAVGASGYGEEAQTSNFAAYHTEADATGLIYNGGGLDDQALDTAYQAIGAHLGTTGHESGAGELTIYNPSSAVYMKPFNSVAIVHGSNDTLYNNYVSGYFTTTTAIDDINFKVESGNFAGIIVQYGLVTA